ncbi:MAG: NUDIX domain-containing protein [Formosimonas sp.]
MPKTTRTATQVVYQNNWMTVREDAVVHPNGQTGVYGVVEKPNFAVIVPLANGQLHLVEQYRYPVQGRFWEFPQGVADEADGDLLRTAHIELREETGYTAQNIIRVGQLFEAYGYAEQSFEVFLATDLTHVGQQLEASEHGLRTQPFEIAQVERMIIDGVIQDAVSVAAFGLLRLHRLI